jgi:hypothetical protein
MYLWPRTRARRRVGEVSRPAAISGFDNPRATAWAATGLCGSSSAKADTVGCSGTTWTRREAVRDHLKAVFGKVGVGSRGELVAKLFAEHYRPSLHAAGAPVTHVQY